MDNNHSSIKLHARSRSRCSAAPKPVSSYDDAVFCSQALSPSDEFYSEIFAGFRGGARGASAIPILDLPPVDENEALFDFRFFDYSEVFGGFEGMVDYAVPFHELFRQSDGGYASSSDDAWTPVETECLSEEWDGSSYSSKRKSFGNESSQHQQSVDDGNQFNISYLRKLQLNEGVLNTAHVAPVHEVPGYAVTVDQISPSQKMELENPQFGADGNASNLIKRGKREENLSDNLAPYCKTVEHEKGGVHNGSHSDEMYITISEINLRTQPNDVPPPSRPPPTFDATYGNTSQATSSVRATCSSTKHISRSISGNTSPPFVDVEVDGRSSAADFGPSITESVKKSQATLKTIQENLQNKNVVMRQVNVCAKDETECVVAVRKSHNTFDDLQHPSRKEGSFNSISAQSSPDLMGQNPILHLSGKKKSKQSWSSEESCEAHSSGEWAAVPEFIVLVRSAKTKTHKQENGEDIIVQNRMEGGGKEERRIPKHEDEINKRVSINKWEDHVNISEAVGEVIKQDKMYKEVLVSLRTTHQCKEVERKVYEEDVQMEDDIYIDIMKNEHEIQKELQKLEQKVNLDEEIMDDARKSLEVGPKESFVAAEEDQKVRKTCEIRLQNLIEQAQSEIRKDAHIKQQNQGAMKTNIEEEKKEPCYKEAFDDEEILKKQKTYDEKEQKEKQLKETERASGEIAEKEENERRKKEEEYVTKLMEASENEAEDMLKEALEEVNKRILLEDFERAEREKKVKIDAEQPQNQESLDQLSRSNDMMFEHTDEKEPEAIKKIHNDLNMMTGSWRSSYLTPNVGINIEATSHRSCKTEKIKEEHIKVLNSVCESDQDNVRSAHEVITVGGKRSNYKQSSDEREMISEYITGNGTNEQLSATKENTALSNRTNMSSNASGEASLYEDYIGVKINTKIPCMAPDSRNLQGKAKVGNVTMLEKAQAQTKMASHDEVGIDKDKLAQKTDREMANNKRSESTHFRMSDGRKQTHNLSQQSKTSQIVGGKDSCRNDGIASEEGAKLERERRAREIELECLREMEEEWEREREREKDRVAFESVTRNVREGAYAGLRERAAVNKVITAEARQKDLANARERLEKSCLEAKEKLYSDKISMEAKMRQDQYAVNKANAEARERAGRSISYSTATYPSTSVNNDKSGLEGESAERCKARLERHQRTAARAAKALAEKNTRDLIAQREQAERHRLAGSLDAEVKRWANGKQGNLRALLSTLQYILGAESGWQPVPLTDIITSVAVKKAYRKATLCVHPDKLQQRRATIQQKYICEKVFDLLKEAWNRFNSEER